MSVGGGNANLIDRTLWRVTPSDHPASRPNSSAVKTSTFQAKRPCKFKRYLTQAYLLTFWRQFEIYASEKNSWEHFEREPLKILQNLSTLLCQSNVKKLKIIKWPLLSCAQKRKENLTLFVLSNKSSQWPSNLKCLTKLLILLQEKRKLEQGWREKPLWVTHCLKNDMSLMSPIYITRIFYSHPQSKSINTHPPLFHT